MRLPPSPGTETKRLFFNYLVEMEYSKGFWPLLIQKCFVTPAGALVDIVCTLYSTIYSHVRVLVIGQILFFEKQKSRLMLLNNLLLIFKTRMLKQVQLTQDNWVELPVDALSHPHPQQGQQRPQGQLQHSLSLVFTLQALVRN